MEKHALFATRDSTGAKELAKSLSGAFGFRIAAVESHLEGVDLPVDKSLDHASAAQQLREGAVGLLVANFKSPESHDRRHASWKEALANFDHETVELVRIAARNPRSTAILSHPRQYQEALELLKTNSAVLPNRYRARQAAAALHAAAVFDAKTAQFIELQSGETPDIDALSGYPRTLFRSWSRGRSLESGATPKQKAALYGDFESHFSTIGGPQPDFACLVDLSLATFAIGEFQKATAIAIARSRILAGSSASELEAAIETVCQDIGTGLVGATLVVNGALDGSILESIDNGPFSTVVAPGFVDTDTGANLRLIQCLQGFGYDALQELRSVPGGVLIQDRNRVAVNPFAWSTPSSNQPLVEQWEEMVFAAKVSRHARSCACVAARGERVLAIAENLVHQAAFSEAFANKADRLRGATFAFDEDLAGPEIIDAAAELGAAVVLHPGLQSDDEGALIDKANELGVVLVATATPMATL